MLQKTVTPDLFRQFMSGMAQDAFDKLPGLLRAQLESMRRRAYRQALRAQRRETKAQAYRAAALAGGGKREVARRAARSC